MDQPGSRRVLRWARRHSNKQQHIQKIGAHSANVVVCLLVVARPLHTHMYVVSPHWLQFKDFVNSNGTFTFSWYRSVGTWLRCAWWAPITQVATSMSLSTCIAAAKHTHTTACEEQLCLWCAAGLGKYRRPTTHCLARNAWYSQYTQLHSENTVSWI